MTGRRISFGCLICVLCFSLGARGAAAEPRKLAFLVGVDKYQKDGLHDLKYAGADAEALEAALKRAGFTAQLVLREEATRDAIRTRFQAFVAETRKCGKQDIVLVSFSGYGVEKEVKRVERRVPEPFFCPYDAQKNDPESLISINQVMQDLIDHSGSSQNLLLIDACRDDPAKGSKGLDGSTVKELPDKLSVLFACSRGQQSYESDKVRQGVFTYFLLEGLKGEAQDASGEISWLDLATYVTKAVPRRLPDLMASEDLAQRPNLVFNMTLVPVLVRPGAMAPPLFDSTKGARTAAEARDAQEAWAKHLGAKVVETNSIGMKLTLIPPGEFMMGSDESFPDLERAFGKPKWLGNARADPVEHPRHRVRVTKPFYLGVYEVTKEQFRQFADAEGYRTDAEKDGGGSGWSQKDKDKGPIRFKRGYTWRSWGVNQGHSSPVVNVSSDDAVAFCEWLSRKEEIKYRLPNEAEWEYACSAGTTTRFYNGNFSEQLVEIGNVRDATFKEMFPPVWAVKGKDGFAFTCGAGLFRPNLFGLYDMIGNAAEWCADYYGSHYYANSPLDDPKGPGDPKASSRVVRGGGWDSDPVYCRSASRDHESSASCNIGFRVLLEL